MGNYRNHDTQHFQTRAGRAAELRKRKKRKEAKMVYWAFVLGISMLLSAFIILTVNEVFAFQKPDQAITVEIPEGATAGKIASILKKADIIDHPILFRMFLSMTTDNPNFIQGKKELNSNLDYRALVRRVTQRAGARQTVRVTIPEGYEVKQILELLVDKGVCDKEALEEVLKNHEFDYDFLKGLKTGNLNRLEGYLFPDTYEFYVGDDAARVINKLLSNFSNKFTENMEERAKELELSVHQVITLASIIEREATANDRKTISSVFHNRLTGGKYPYLQSCATVQYALGERKTVLSVADTKIDSPYNTYQNKGLPPGPIASPGSDSIEAALYPADTNYLFFALQKDGTHKFSKTYEEHLKVPNLNPNS